MGGVGLIEMQTGLPIGHHSLECPHAAAAGMATWDLADAAVDFYDRNCAGCSHRKPVGFPNISELVAARDKAKAEKEEEAKAYQEKVASELARRDAAREAIRQELSPVQATVLDQLRELDHNPTSERVTQLVETAKVAPEHFTASVQDHLMELLDIGGWSRSEACLGVLEALGAPADKLCNAALKALGGHDAVHEAAALVLKHAAAADEKLIAKALSSLIGLANPKSSPIMGGRQHVDPRPLQVLFRHHPKAVKEGIERILDSNSAYRVETAARGIEAISESDPAFAVGFATTLVSKLVRANHLLQDLDERDFEQTGVIRKAIAAAFAYSPDEVDKIIQGFVVGADDDGRAAIVSIYNEVLRDLQFGRGRFGAEKVPPTNAHALAFKRLIWAATSMQGTETLQALQSALHGELYDLAPLATQEIDSLLGASALLDDKLDTKTSPLLTGIQDPVPQELAELEQWNRQGTLSGLQETFVRWACQAARAGGMPAVETVLAFFRQLPEDRENLRAAFIGNMHKMISGNETLNAILPDFYSALVGGFQVWRSSAASALGEFAGRRHNDLPDLVYEAFVPLLTDPFVIVHQAAVRALERFTLPEALAPQARNALVVLVMTYAQSRSNDRFLLDCLELLCGRYEPGPELEPQLASTVLALLKRAKPSEVSRDIRFWGRRLRNHAHFGDLLLHLLQDREAIGYHADNLYSELKKLPPHVIQANLNAIERFGLLGNQVIRGRAGFIVGLLSEAGAGEKALNVARAAYAAIEDTAWNKPVKLDAELRMIACEYEHAIASGDSAGLAGVGQRWRRAHKEREVDLATHKQRRDPLRGLLG